MSKNKSTLTQESQDDIQLDVFEDYEGLDVEDDIFYQFNSKTYYGAKSAYVEVEDYDFDNYGYNDYYLTYIKEKPPGYTGGFFYILI